MAPINNENQLYQSQQVSTQRNSLYQHHHQQQQQRNRLIEPAPTKSRSSYSSSITTAAAPYAKSNSSSVYATGTTLASNNPAVVRRNARERNRVKQVNNGFLNLRQHIPTAIIADLSNGRRGIGPGANKKLSKVDTLRMAVEYIRRLQDVIDEVDSSDVSSVSSFNSSCGSSASPQHDSFPNHYIEQQRNELDEQRYFGMSYAGSYPTIQQQQQQQQQQHQQHQLTSPAASIGSYSSTDSPFNFSANVSSSVSNVHNQLNLKCEQPYEDYTNVSTDDDEELLDYISLWQEDM